MIHFQVIGDRYLSLITYSLCQASGYYVYIETSSRAYGDEARISSSTVDDTPRGCLMFWYHMHGETVDTLNVLLYRNSGTSSPRVIWSRHGDHADHWFLASVNIDEIFPYQVTEYYCVDHFK